MKVSIKIPDGSDYQEFQEILVNEFTVNDMVDNVPDEELHEQVMWLNINTNVGYDDGELHIGITQSEFFDKFYPTLKQLGWL